VFYKKRGYEINVNAIGEPDPMEDDRDILGKATRCCAGTCPARPGSGEGPDVPS